MKLRKQIAAATAAVMALSLLTSCSTPSSNSAAADEQPESVEVTDISDTETENAVQTGSDEVDFTELYGDEVIELTVFSQVANYSGKMTGWFAELMKEKYNCEIIIIPDLNGSFDLRTESGNLGDIVIFGNNGDQYRRAVENGLLFDWNEDDILDEYGSYIKDNMTHTLKRNADYSMEIIGKDTVYGISNNVASSSADHESFFYTWDIRWDLYDALGRPEIKDLDDYFDLLVKMKEICPTDENGKPTYAVSLWPDWDSNIVMYVNSFATAYWGYDGLPFGLYDLNTGEYYFSADKDSPYIKSLKFFNRLYRAGLLDPNSMTQTYTEVTEKVTCGGTFFSIFDYAGSKLYNTDKHIAENKMMLPLTPEDATPCTYGMNVLGGNRVFSIGSSTEYPELCMAILNYLCTPEGYLTYLYGPKDVCWYYDENGSTCFTELGELCYNDKETEMPEEWGGRTFKDRSFPINSSTWSIDATNPESNGDTYNAQRWVTRQSEPCCEIEKEWREFTGAVNSQEYLDGRDFTVAVGTTYSESKRSDELKIVWEQVARCVVEYSWNAIYAKDDAEFEALTDEMRKDAMNMTLTESLKNGH